MSRHSTDTRTLRTELVLLAHGTALWLRLPSHPLGCPWRCVVEEVGPGPTITVAGLPFEPHRQTLKVAELQHLAAEADRLDWRMPTSPGRVAALLAQGQAVWLPRKAMGTASPVDAATAASWLAALGVRP